MHETKTPHEQNADAYTKQFNRPEVLKASAQRKRYKDYIYEVRPEQQAHAVPVFICPGFLSGPVNFGALMRALYNGGRHTLALDATYGIDRHQAGIATDTIDQHGTAGDQQKDNAAAILAALNQKGLEQVDAIGHSQGAINLIIAALEQPERFRNLVLVNPGGLIGEDTLAHLALRSRNQDKYEEKHLAQLDHDGDDEALKLRYKQREERQKNAPKSLIKYLESALGVAASTIHDAIVYLRKEYGIKVTIVHGVEDEYFSSERMAADTLKKGSVDGFLSVKKGHNEPLFNEQYMGAIEGLLNTMEQA